MESTERIRTFIRDEILFEDSNRDITDGTPLLEGQIIDSLGLMELVAFLEEEFEIEVDDADITTDHFRTVADIAQMVERHRGERRGSAASADGATVS